MSKNKHTEPDLFEAAKNIEPAVQSGGGSGIFSSGNVVSYLDEMQESFLDYAMSVITSRALPDIRDGLKPVQRRILYAMYTEGLLAGKKFSKCAGIVGEVLKKWHPHGDLAVYEALVRLAQPWVMRVPLVEGQGNFGSIDGDSAAAYRYTEARLDKLSEYMLKDIEKETIDTTDNYNNTEKEPIVMPSRFPNLLINGTSGIAVGMATNIPPHNLTEVLDALLVLIDKPDTEVNELMKYVKGPDFPTGAMILGTSGIAEAYSTGRGTVRIRAKVSKEQVKDKNRIIISEIPYAVVKSRITLKIAELVKTKKIDGITDIRDESTKEGIRIVLELKKDAAIDFIIEKLYKQTALDTNFSVNIVVLVDGRPKQVTLKEILELFIGFRKEVIRRRTLFDLKKAKTRMIVLEGFRKVLLHKDEYLKEILPKAKDKDSLKTTIETRYVLNPVQSEAVVVLPNYRFSGMEVEKIMEEYNELAKEVETLQNILKDDNKIKSIIKSEFNELKKLFPEQRKTSIVSEYQEKALDDLIPDQKVFVSITDSGFIKRYSYSSEVSERDSNVVFTGDDVVRFAIEANTANFVYVFTSDARAYPLQVFSIPEMRRYGKGIDIHEILKLDEGVSVVGICSDISKEKVVTIITAQGFVKKIIVKDLETTKASGLAVFKLREQDSVIDIVFEDATKMLVLPNETKKIKNLIYDLSVVPVSERGKAATKITEGIASCAIISSDDEAVTLVFKDGSLKQAPAITISKAEVQNNKPVACVVKKTNSEIIAHTASGQYIVLNFAEEAKLSASEKITKIFTYEAPVIAVY